MLNTSRTPMAPMMLPKKMPTSPVAQLSITHRAQEAADERHRQENDRQAERRGRHPARGESR
jgi:hypothetical protein